MVCLMLPSFYNHQLCVQNFHSFFLNFNKINPVFNSLGKNDPGVVLNNLLKHFSTGNIFYSEVVLHVMMQSFDIKKAGCRIWKNSNGFRIRFVLNPNGLVIQAEFVHL